MNLESNKIIHARGTDSARVIQVIRTRAMRGAGIESDPVREVVQYWSFDGKMLWEEDSFNPSASRKEASQL